MANTALLTLILALGALHCCLLESAPAMHCLSAGLACNRKCQTAQLASDGE